jgi:hypothetical protein
MAAMFFAVLSPVIFLHSREPCHFSSSLRKRMARKGESGCLSNDCVEKAGESSISEHMEARRG